MKRVLWYVFSNIFINTYWCPVSSVKVSILRLFGAKIGKGVTLKPNMNIKYPWKLELGNYVWIGENVWIDNLEKVTIADNCCLSQGVTLICGNHNYKKSTFDLIVKEITLEEGVWIGAKSFIGPGVTCASHSLLAVQSVATADLEAYTIYRGNPARKVANREISA